MIDKEKLLQSVLDLFPGIEYEDVTLVGSRAMNYSTDDSDYDVIIWTKETLSSTKRGEYEGCILSVRAKPIHKKILKLDGEEFLLPSFSLITGETFDFDQKVIDRWKEVYKK